jgi:hypothetical protein
MGHLMRGTFYGSREFQIPKGAQKVSDKRSDAVAYLYANDRGQPCEMVFYGNQSKPVQRYKHRTEAAREQFIKRAFEARQQHQARKSERHAERASATATKKFEVGKIYHDRSSCDWDTIYSFEIIARTDKQLTIKEHDKTYRRGIYVYDGVECCKPHGTYSMCAVISADRGGRI